MNVRTNIFLPGFFSETFFWVRQFIFLKSYDFCFIRSFEKYPYFLLLFHSILNNDIAK